VKFESKPNAFSPISIRVGTIEWLSLFAHEIVFSAPLIEAGQERDAKNL
jgi:hypothetical protein